MKKLYVGNLPWSVDEAKLKEIFGKYSSVTSTQIIKDRQTNRSRGFGFVEFSDDTEADTAAQEMNGADVDGRKLVVNPARPMESRDR